MLPAATKVVEHFSMRPSAVQKGAVTVTGRVKSCDVAPPALTWPEKSTLRLGCSTTWYRPPKAALVRISSSKRTGSRKSASIERTDAGRWAPDKARTVSSEAASSRSAALALIMADAPTHRA